MTYVITFPSTHQALRAEKVLREQGFKISLIPVPREVSSNCGLALKFKGEDKEEIILRLKGDQVTFEGIYQRNLSGFKKIN